MSADERIRQHDNMLQQMDEIKDRMAHHENLVNHITILSNKKKKIIMNPIVFVE
jgi:hypothetical protein